MRALTRAEVGTECECALWFAVFGDAQRQWIAGMPEPDFRCIDAMPVRALAGAQQEVDRGRVCAALGIGCVAVGFGIVAAFGWGLRLRAAMISSALIL